MKKSDNFSPAHYRESDNSFQTVEEHIQEVRNRAMNYGFAIELGNLCELAGILHDMGRFTDEFRAYFMESVEGREAKGSEQEIGNGKSRSHETVKRYRNFGR